EPMLLKSLDSLAARALAANAPFTIVAHPTGEHPFERSGSLAAREVVASTVTFLRSNLDPAVQRDVASNLVLARAGQAMQAGDWPAAVAAYEELDRRSPNDAEFARRLGDARLGAGQYSGAIEAYLKARRLGHWRRGDITIGLISAYG